MVMAATDLSAEDALRLNVLLANELQAIRIDESSMTVHGLGDDGESVVRLNPNCRDEQYLKRVRELISSHVLGSPGGYPIYLRRWTRMGQARDDSLEKLLLLGEPEAVVAVVHAAGLTEELARRAWWAMPTADNARRMLTRETVARSPLGPVLAEYLVDYLPFEQEHQAMIDSIRLILQPGLIDAETRQRIWNMGKRRNTYYVGFLYTTPDDLPDSAPPHPRLADFEPALSELEQAGNVFARQLLRILRPAGQAFLNTAAIVFRKPNNQEVVVALIEAVEGWFGTVSSGEPRLESPQDAMARVDNRCCPTGQAQIRAVIERLPDIEPFMRAMLYIAELSERQVAPIFARTDAIGTVMRKKLDPVFTPLLDQFAILQGKA